MLYHIAGDLLPEHFHKLGSLRPRSHEGHLPHQDIEKLGELIDGGAPDKFPDARNSGIPRCRPAVFLLLRFLLNHRTELIHHKGAIVATDPLLPEDHRSRGPELDEQSHRQHNGTEDEERGKRSRDIHRPLHSGIEGIRQRDISDIDDGQSVHILCHRL